MRNTLYIPFLLLTMFFCASPTEAQTSMLMQQGKTELDNYNRMVSNGSSEQRAYEAAYKSVDYYSRAISQLTSTSPDYNTCKRALRELFPVMSDGAYFFANVGRQDKVLEYACAYIDISLLSVFADAGLQNAQSYPVLANLAATNIYNRGDYQRAADYFKAYLSTTDTENRELAFEGLARCFYEQKDYGWAGYIASQGVSYYPSNWNMLLIGIESFGHTNSDDKMEPLINNALRLSPGHKGLLEYQGKLYERQKRFSLAAKTFEQLYGINNLSLDYALHLGFNLYNAATESIHKAKDPTTPKSEVSKLNVEAREYFSKAAPVLRDVLNNSPYAANVARALAMCYAMTNDSEKLRQANQTLTAMRVEEVAQNEIPLLDLSYQPMVELKPINQNTMATTTSTPKSDVDINIPVTNRKNNKTYAIIIGNEEYKNKDIRSVPYAKNDAAIFSEYCKKTLGISDDHIKVSQNATLSELNGYISMLRRQSEIYPNEINVIFYYAGHGSPDRSNHESFLIPHDALDGENYESLFSVNKLCDDLNNMQIQKAVVFLDACFTGDAARGDEPLLRGRFVSYEPEDVVPAGNTIVFNATNGKQTAQGYDEQSHGFFTYFLLKALQESRGEITLKDLADQVNRNVRSKSLDKLNREQSPHVVAADALGTTWHAMKLY